MAAMSTQQVAAQVSQLVKDCENYRDELSVDRIKAMEYYDGIMKDTPADPNRSKVVSRDVRSAIKKVLPSVIRTILGNDKVVEYQPVNEGDEAAAEQATDYVNFVVFPESDGYDAVQDAAHDALKLRNGIIRWWYDKKRKVQVSKHTGLEEQALVQLVADDDVEVLEQEQYEEQIDTPQGPQPVTLYNVKIRRVSEYGCTKLAAVPLEEFLIHPDAISIDDSPITGMKTRLRRSDLVEMGYDRGKVDSFPASGSDIEEEEEEFTRRRDAFDENDSIVKALQEVDYYELYVKIDADDDGIAELRRMVFAGGLAEVNLLDDEEWDEVPFADLITERRPHQREGNSVTDDMAEIQRVKTVLMRQTLDNLYWQNNQQPIVQEGTIANPEAVLNPKFGQPIRVNQGIDVRGAIGYNTVPFVAEQSFGMLSYLDQEATDRTGISDASSGMAPDALQNMTAKASAMIEAAGVGQTELMVRTFAQGLKRVFQGLLRLVIKHQDKPRTVRLRNQWVTFDPRQWNADMDCAVNTGLGAGTRERDMMMMQVVGQQQEKLLAAYGPVNNPYVSAENIWNSVSRGVEAAGLRTPDLYFTKPTPEQIKQLEQAQANKPDPEMEKVKIKAQADQQKAQMDAQLQREKMQQEAQLETQRIQQEMALKRYQIEQEIQLKRQTNAMQMLTRDPVASVNIGGDPG
ncbi:phage portal protein [Sinorhizobium medicae]|uniref:portal protein n=1 Tax=Sinorhizobium medicae TaxID=110321 RepID=UPI001AAD0AB7|nr:phage portal protein [Sinorhizobium medicae]MBO1943167.1 phage portal protein [Sinorhizobium medicae]MDX0921809.1 phage portal protein [Sinorhizobium medicae]MDX0926673.1 phage portal protein [Sinorhizobium medicae]MDX0934113.1 phage portal protein [Sinorhizobium medicae]MDX0940307.1 phage portal protein [Sinorhizobium medicae]